MSNDFDLGADFEFEDGFEDLDAELAEMDEFDDDIDDLQVRTAVLQKNDMVALLCIKSAAEGASICRVDPRDPRPAIQLYDDPEKALEWFTKSLRTSRKNGWNIVYDGLPLQG
ncbi:MAG TPA: hypothetical protein VK468_06400 [Pyrinomonadaceae bacterium]|nr:hypothetical protein [Pyrinomonadaceae bacterium]